MAEPQRRKGDPATCRHHSDGNDYTKNASACCIHLTTYSVSRPDPHAPPQFKRPTNQSMGTTMLLQGGVNRPLPTLVALCCRSVAGHPEML